MPRCYKQPSSSLLDHQSNIDQEAGFPIKVFFYAHLQFVNWLRYRLDLAEDPVVYHSFVPTTAGYDCMMYHDLPMLVKSSDDMAVGDQMFGVIFDVRNGQEYRDIKDYVRTGLYKTVSLPVIIRDPMYEGENPSQAWSFVWRSKDRSPLTEGSFDTNRFHRRLRRMERESEP